MRKKTITISESSVRELLAQKKFKFKYREVKDEDIDYSDIPELTAEQKAKFKPRFPLPLRKTKTKNR